MARYEITEDGTKKVMDGLNEIMDQVEDGRFVSVACVFVHTDGEVGCSFINGITSMPFVEVMGGIEFLKNRLCTELNTLIIRDDISSKLQDIFDSRDVDPSETN